METILFVPRISVFILMGLGLTLAIVLLTQLISGLFNLIGNHCRQTMTSQSLIFNLYLFHHIIVCIIRCITTFTICFLLIIYDQCIDAELFIHFLLLLSTFDLFLIIIGETAHFWDSAINYKSTLYSKYCLLFGIFFIYFLSILFLSVHITMGGDNPLIINICKSIKQKNNFFQNFDNEKTVIPTITIFILFILLDLLTLAWIYTAYDDIFKLKRKCLATLFFHSLLFTPYKEVERTNMVNRSLKRLSSICLFVISNMIVILPILTVKVFDLQLNIYFRIFFIYLTMLPWCESLTFLFFKEMKFNFLKKTYDLNENPHLRERIGTRLSTYGDTIIRTHANDLE